LAKAVATRAVDLEPIDRLEEKVKLLVAMIDRLRADNVRAADENARLARELDASRTRLAEAEGTGTELASLREERDLIRSRVGEMLQQIEAQQYPIRSTVEPAYVAELAAYVDEKMRLASRETPGSDTLKVAVLAALNIADEVFRARDEQRVGHDQLASRAGELEHMLDLALGFSEDHAVAR
jgi:cell division protein ZapA